MAGRTATKRATNRGHESRLLDLIDKADTIRRYDKDIKRMIAGSLDPVGFFKAASVDAAIHIVDMMTHGDSDRVRMDACKDVLDRGGYGATTKHQVTGNVKVDHDTSKAELVNIVMTMAKQVGFPVRDSLPEAPAPQTIDVDSALVEALPPKGVDEAPAESPAATEEEELDELA
jgi:hypothetical protein